MKFSTIVIFVCVCTAVTLAMWPLTRKDGQTHGYSRSVTVGPTSPRTPAAKTLDWSSYSTRTTLERVGDSALSTSLYQVFKYQILS